MLGWHISVFRQKGDGLAPATDMSEQGARLAVWQTGWEGLRWIDDLVEDGKAIALATDGYPTTYTGQAEHLIPWIVNGPPGAHRTWVRESFDVVTDQWEGKTLIDQAAVNDCRPEEWLVIEAWDES